MPRLPGDVSWLAEQLGYFDLFRPARSDAAAGSHPELHVDDGLARGAAVGGARIALGRRQGEVSGSGRGDWRGPEPLECHVDTDRELPGCYQEGSDEPRGTLLDGPTAAATVAARAHDVVRVMQRRGDEVVRGRDRGHERDQVEETRGAGVVSGPILLGLKSDGRPG